MKKTDKNGSVHGDLIIKISLCLLLNFSLLNGCQQKDKVDNIRIFYLPEGTSFPLAMTNCDDIFLHNQIMKDTIIKDRKNIQRIIALSKTLKVSKDSVRSIDYRIRCTIKYYDKSKKVICLGEYDGISSNGIAMENDSIFLNTIKDIIYKR